MQLQLCLFLPDIILKFDKRLHRNFQTLEFSDGLLLLFKKYLNHIDGSVISLSLDTCI